MATGLQGLTGLQGYVNSQPEATAEEIQGSAANPAHEKNFWEEPEQYPWESAIAGFSGTTYPPVPPIAGVGDSPDTLAAGYLGQDPTGDYTPRTHAAPWPKGLDGIRAGNQQPHGNADYLQQSMDIHASKTNAGAAMLYDPTLEAQNDDWTAFYDVEPGNTMLDSNIGSQGKSGFAPGGFGSHSREQSNAIQNNYGFDSAHMHRRWATGSVPGNYMWMKPGGRPMVKSLPGPARPPVGPSSPFAGQDVSWGFTASGPVGGVLTNAPTSYQQPPTPYVAPTQPVQDEAPTIDFY